MKRNRGLVHTPPQTKESKQQKGGEHPPAPQAPADELSPLHHDIRLDYRRGSTLRALNQHFPEVTR